MFGGGIAPLIRKFNSLCKCVLVDPSAFLEVRN